MTGATGEIKDFSIPYKGRKPNRVLNDLFMAAARILDMNTTDELPSARGSSDFGDFSQVAPGIHPYFSINENFATATGTRADAYNLLIAVVIAVIIVLAMNLVGSLLISALVIFPALSAMRIFRSFLHVTICSAVLSVVCSFTGIVIAILAGTPVGSTIVAVQVLGFAACCAVGALTRGAV